MAHKIGVSGSEYTLPSNPEAGDYQVGPVPLAGMARALDGSALTDFVADKLQWSGHWSALTAAQRDFIMTELRRQAHLSWYPPEAATTQYTVRVIEGHWAVTPGTSDVYDVYFALEQV